MDALEKSTRIFVLAKALYIEDVASRVLADILNIKRESSKTLGNKSSAFSFSTKIDLLIDLDVLSSKDKRKFQVFMEIRNQFMHNYKAISFVECMSFIDSSNEQFLLNNYSDDPNVVREINLRNCFDSLAKNVIELILGIFDVISERKKEIVQKEVSGAAFEAALDTIEDVVKAVDKVFDDLLSKDDFDKSKLKSFGQTVGKIFNSGFKMRFDEIMSDRSEDITRKGIIGL